MKYTYHFENSFLGKIITLDNGCINFSVTLEVGPRIISLRAGKAPNIMFQDLYDNINKDCSAIYGKGEKWHIYGGHRLWLSPENLSTYYPDNNEISYELVENGILVYPDTWKIVDVKPKMLIEFIDKNKLKITHKVKNIGKKRKLCLWALTVMKAGGTMTFFLPKKDTGFLPNRNIVLWPYSEIKDGRIEIKDNKIFAKSDIEEPKPFKIGSYNSELKAEYILENQEGKTRFVKVCQCAEGFDSYPDFGCNFECYFNDKIHEIETLSPISNVSEGEEIEHIEFWEIY